MIGSKSDGLKFYDGCETYLLIDYMATEFDIEIVKKGELFVAISKETQKILFFSSDVKVVYKALLYLAEKESEEDA